MNERSEFIIERLLPRGGVVMADVAYLVLTVVVFGVVWFALRGVEKL